MVKVSTNNRFPRVGPLALALALWVAAAPGLLAHQGEPLSPHDLWTAWSWEPGVLLSLALSAWLYYRGLARLWKESAPGRGIFRWEALSFGVGWLGLLIALVSPLHSLGGVLFSAHMTQHEVLMLVAAPLLVLGRPLIPFLWALPMGWRRRLGGLGRSQWVQAGWHTVTGPLPAWSIHALVLWVWHAPVLFQATLESELVHTLQHLSFLLSALMFWWALIRGHQGRMGYGAAVLYLFTTAVHTSILGALLTFSSILWYPAYGSTTAAWGLTPLEDQQLGGLVMWVPAGLVYIIGGLALFAGWLRESERRVAERESDAAARAAMDGA